MTEQVGCEAEDARFIACDTCLFRDDANQCEDTRKEGNLKVCIK